MYTEEHGMSRGFISAYLHPEYDIVVGQSLDTSQVWDLNCERALFLLDPHPLWLQKDCTSHVLLSLVNS